MLVIVVYVVGGAVLRRHVLQRTRGPEPRGGALGPEPAAARLLREKSATIDAQAIYAFASARVSLRLAELRAALDKHEADPANWARFELLDRVEGVLGELVEEVEKP